jgi:hypothetical protein
MLTFELYHPDRDELKAWCRENSGDVRPLLNGHGDDHNRIVKALLCYGNAPLGHLHSVTIEDDRAAGLFRLTYPDAKLGRPAR